MEIVPVGVMSLFTRKLTVMIRTRVPLNFFHFTAKSAFHYNGGESDVLFRNALCIPTYHQIVVMSNTENTP